MLVLQPLTINLYLEENGKKGPVDDGEVLQELTMVSDSDVEPEDDFLPDGHLSETSTVELYTHCCVCFYTIPFFFNFLVFY